MLYLLPLSQTVELQSALNLDEIVVFQSTLLNTSSDVSYTALNLLNAAGDYLLHISVRPSENVIVFNSRTASGGWGPEERVSFTDAFPDGVKEPTIVVYDRGDSYRIRLGPGGITVNYAKRLSGDIAKLSYTVSGDISAFSNPVVVNTYTLDNVLLLSSPAFLRCVTMHAMEPSDGEHALQGLIGVRGST
ncbi:hypothetical protein EW146_g6 [Bondarzewia mesenterica]|uniref:Galectin n=1 Tax=Bondarzewia mesenterica TaxID=1095465 RepID=A0A4S4M8H2_9AGAM|nr:hypothetical protein EW146_g6 [Bondarzewia mesenterica]